MDTPRSVFQINKNTRTEVATDTTTAASLVFRKSDPTNSKLLMRKAIKLWRVSELVFQFRTSEGQFLTCSGDGGSVTATAESPSDSETFYIERNFNNRVHIKLKGGTYIQASNDNILTADIPGTPGWDDNATIFEITAVEKMQVDYQLANGYGHDKAKEILKKHWNSFITVDDFNFLYKHGINAVRIPVDWWIASDSNLPAPFIGGSLEALIMPSREHSRS